MANEIRVPTLGESIVDATIATWLKHEGDPVRQGDALVELETDKVNVEVNAEQDGVLQKVLKREGDVVTVGEVLGMIGSAEQAINANVQSQQSSQTSSRGGETAPVSDRQTPLVEHNQQQQQPSPVAQTSTPANDAQRPPSPLARRVAAEYNVDISQVRSVSPHGRVTREDVLQYVQSQRETAHSSQSTQDTTAPANMTSPNVPSQAQPAAQPSAPERGVENGAATTRPAPPSSTSRGREERIRMSRRRQTIAQRLVDAQHTAAMLTTFNEIDMTAVMDVRNRRKDAFKERHQVSLGFMSFFTKAVVGALKAYPMVNAEIQGNEIVLKYYYDIGIAVATEEGLVVPVVRDADRKSFAEIEREIADLAKRARESKLTLSELQGGTFSITNGGVFGSLLSTPILNGPQVGILGMHKIEQRPIALNSQVVIRPMMYVALSYDHRIIDGSEAVRFLVKVKELVEDPEALLLEG